MSEHRERLFLPTIQCRCSAQSLNIHAPCRPGSIAMSWNGLRTNCPLCSTPAGAHCKTQQRLPLPMVRSLLLPHGRLLAGETSAAWGWQDSAMRLDDGTTVTVTDIADAQARNPQTGSARQVFIPV